MGMSRGTWGHWDTHGDVQRGTHQGTQGCTQGTCGCNKDVRTCGDTQGTHTGAQHEETAAHMGMGTQGQREDQGWTSISPTNVLPRPHVPCAHPHVPNPCPHPHTPLTRMLMLKSPSGTISGGTSPGSSRLRLRLSAGTPHHRVKPHVPMSPLSPSPHTHHLCPGRRWSPPGAALPRAAGMGGTVPTKDMGTHEGTNAVPRATEDRVSPNPTGTNISRATTVTGTWCP